METSESTKINPYNCLTQQDKDKHLLIAATSFQESTDIVLLLKEKANVNARCTSGMTPVMYAASNGIALNLILLIQAGANLSALSKFSESALSKSIEHGYFDIMFLLFTAMSDEQINNEITRDYYLKMKVYYDIFKQAYSIKIFNALGQLFTDNHTINPFSHLPYDIKRLIYTYYSAARRQLDDKTVDRESDTIEIFKNMTENRPLIFSQKLFLDSQKDLIENMNQLNLDPKLELKEEIRPKRKNHCTLF